MKKSVDNPDVRYQSNYCKYLRGRVKSLEKAKYIQLMIIIILLALVGVLGYQINKSGEKIAELEIIHSIAINSLSESHNDKMKLEEKHKEEMNQLLEEFQ